MKITRATLHRYSLPLKRELKLKDRSYTRRDGFLLELTADSGAVAFGDIAPLAGFSYESLEQAEATVRSILPRLVGRPVGDDFTDNIPGSVAFAVETALLPLRAQEKGVSPVQMLAPGHRKSVSINGLLPSGDETETLERAALLIKQGYRTLKLKVGQRSVDADIAIVKSLRREIGGRIALRLDANRSMTIDDYDAFSGGVAECDIEYIEEPIHDIRHLFATRSDLVTRIPLALDETLLEIPPDALPFFQMGVQAVVVKPTLLGFDRARRICAVADMCFLTATISSAFCSGVGMLPHLWLAAAVGDSGSVAGFDTISWFERDLLKPSIGIAGGSITLASLPDPVHALQRDLLAEVDRAG